MRPLSEFPIEERRNLRVLLTDIDDTMTTEGLLPASSLEALERLAAAGVIVIPVTGRPAGWCDHIARMWPVHAVVGENGAFYFSYDREARKMRSSYAKPPEERSRDRERLKEIRKRVLQDVPGAGIASDQAYRVADLAVDFCEDVKPLPMREVERIVKIFQEAGATTKISSIHVNGWFGGYDKLSTTRRCLIDLFDIDMAVENQRITFCGDSPNDEPMFAYFENSIGVANVTRFKLQHMPAWIASREGAAGFAEIAAAILEARKIPVP